MRILWLLLFPIFLGKSALSQTVNVSNFQTTTPHNGFLKNMGQVKDFNGKLVPFVYYQANVNGQRIYVTDYGLSILLSRPKVITQKAIPPVTGMRRTLPARQDSATIITWELERIDIVLLGASIREKEIVTINKKESPQFNFYIEAFQTSHQPVYLQQEIIIQNVYPGIDWKLYINEDKQGAANLKYDFIIHPGADISKIKLKYSNNATIELVNEEIKAATKMGTLIEKKPFSYLQEDNAEVNVAYKVKKNAISFDCPAYDTTKTLVIDPSVFWLTYLSSTGSYVHNSIRGKDIETDSSGNIFVQLSASWGVPFPTLNAGGGAYYQNYTAAPDGAMIIIKFAPGGQMLWSTYFGNGVAGKLMTRDKFNNIITVGELMPGIPSYPISNPTIPLLNNGGYYDGERKQYFIAKFSNSGVLQWSSYYSGFSSYPMDMSYDINGNVYVVGWSGAYQFPFANPGAGAYVVSNPQHGSAQVLCISQFNASNQLLWSTRIEGNDYDPSARVCTDKAGNIYVAGQLRSTNYPLVDAGGYFNTSQYASVITRFNPARQMTWSTGIPAGFSLNDLTTDDSCNLYLLADKRIFKFDSSTNLIYVNSVNSTRMHFWNKINYDSQNNQVHLLGVMNDSEYDFPTQNTQCNGSFFNNGSSPNAYHTATSPIFATINAGGQFTYLSLADWPYEYYDECEMAIDKDGALLYLFDDQQNGFGAPNPQLTNPGNGAYYDPNCCYISNGNKSAMLLKLTSSTLNVITQVTAPAGCSCNGTATAIPQCGTAPFTYLWSNAVTTATNTSLCPGNHWVIVTDASGLTTTVYVNVALPPGSITSISPTLISENCNRSNAVISIQSVQGGSMPYTFSLDGINYSISSQFTGLTSGNYIVRVKDANGCVFNDTINIPRISGPTDATLSIQKSTCLANDGQLQVNNVQGGIGPYVHSLNGSVANTTGLFTGLAGASYQLIISDTAGCILTRTVQVERATAATNAAFISGNDHCSQKIGFIEVTNVTGGTAPYSYSTDSIVFYSGRVMNLARDSYSLYIKDNNGCILKTGPIGIGDDNGPTDVAFAVKEAYCGKLTGDIEIRSVTGGIPPYSYALDGNSFGTTNTFTNIQPGAHNLYVRDVFNCIYTESLQINYKPVPLINLLPVDTTVCYDEVVFLHISGQPGQVQNVVWNIPAQNISASWKATENKTVVIRFADDNGCIITDTSYIKVKPCNTPEKCLVIPNAFTPNNDGKNDLLKPLTNGCRIESIRFLIYDRWGEMIYETSQQSKGWDGTFKGLPGLPGVYVYVCDYVTSDGISRVQKGTINLIR